MTKSFSLSFFFFPLYFSSFKWSLEDYTTSRLIASINGSRPKILRIPKILDLIKHTDE